MFIFILLARDILSAFPHLLSANGITSVQKEWAEESERTKNATEENIKSANSEYIADHHLSVEVSGYIYLKRKHFNSEISFIRSFYLSVITPPPDFS